MDKWYWVYGFFDVVFDDFYLHQLWQKVKAGFSCNFLIWNRGVIANEIKCKST